MLHGNRSGSGLLTCLFLGLSTFVLPAQVLDAAGQAPSPTAGNASPATLATLPPAGAVSLLGAEVSRILALFGPPPALYALRGLEPWQDDVVFDYPERGVACFFWHERVWQLRLGAGSPELVPGLAWPVTPAGLEERLGPPDRPETGWLEWPVGGLPWRVRLRLLPAADGQPEQLYLYRADF